MNIPHQEPIKFAKELLEVNKEFIKVKCEFSSLPTLPMLFEAAAQSSAGFSQEKEAKIGFLVSVKEVKLNKEPDTLEYVIKVEKNLEFGAVCEFSFNVFDLSENTNYTTGVLTVMIQE